MWPFRRKKPETDVPLDTAVAASREQPSGEFVGRVAGDDPGDFGESGAERRAAAQRQSADGQRPGQD